MLKPVGRKRNPNWTRDETVLLMNLYMCSPRAGKVHPDVVALSQMLRSSGQRNGRAHLNTFRNPAGVAMRLRNFGRHDPTKSLEMSAGLRPGGKVDIAVWKEFDADRAGLAIEVARVERLFLGIN